ncbi:Mov34/MPN/PAD-1 family protein [Phytohabitans rumicis]|uniref:Mov34/MPN/PAD-1 family protein n=1 Tax=Phytohabitans rumicis TaxID=1076125 RepID=UPI001564485F|nr:Mov34/MPN/PAD-1 family protein [Phytohabitans rumicis]
MDETRGDQRAIEVLFGPGLVRSLLAYIGGARQHERGGVLLGRRDERAVRIGAAVFPPQLAQARDHCAFDVTSIDVIRKAVTELPDRRTREMVGAIVGWVHSHPGHGLFLSRTDMVTLSAWAQLDERAIAVVVDPFLHGPPEERIAWWPAVGGRGRTAGTSGGEDDGMTVTMASAVADQIADAPRASYESWDLVTSYSIISVFPRPAAPGGGGHRATPKRREPRW